MQDFNINFIQLEQGIKNLIVQSELSILVVDSILKNISYDIQEQKQRYLIQLNNEIQNQQRQQDAKNELTEEE